MKGEGLSAPFYLLEGRRMALWERMAGFWSHNKTTAAVRIHSGRTHVSKVQRSNPTLFILLVFSPVSAFYYLLFIFTFYFAFYFT